MKIQRMQTQTGSQLITFQEKSAYYFLNCVFILFADGKYRLVVIHEKRKLLDKKYKTLRGARIAFSKFFKMDMEIPAKMEWSPFYTPELPWLDKLLNLPLAEKQKKLLTGQPPV